jgi:dihydroxy-acid dehydratase
VGGPLALLRDGDRVAIDAEKETVSAELDDAEWAKGGVLAKYARLARPASEGAGTTGPASGRQYLTASRP